MNVASYSYPFCDAVTELSVKVAEVAPATVDQLLPPSIETIHCTVGVGAPLALALKLTGLLATTAWLVGWPVICGATALAITDSVAALLVALPATLVKTARYS